MISNIKKYVFALIFIVPFFRANAQFNVSTYQLFETLPQANLLNPAILPNNKIVIGLPALSSIYMKTETTLSASNLFRRAENDSLVINTEELTKNIYKNYKISALADVQIFLFGLNLDNGYINVGMRLRSDSRVLFPGEIFRWALFGPGDDRSSNRLDFEDFKVQSMTFMETAFGYTHRISSFFNAGARIKILSGIGVLKGSQTGGITLSPEVIDFKITDFSYQSAGIPLTDNGSVGVNTDFYSNNPSEALFQGNGGFAFDFGATFKPIRDLELSASVIDIGYISWKENLNTITIPNVEYKFTGIDARDFILGDNAVQDQQNEIDSLANLLKPQLETTESFTTPLSAKATLSARYLVGERNYVGATLYSDFFRGTLDPVFALNYQARFGKVLSLVTGLAFQNRSINNLLFGFVFKPGPFQFYLLSDRLNSVFFPARADEFNFRLGMNLVFGTPSILE